MFFLGILVGRGTSPVTFDTKSFHTRLEAIVQSYEKTAPEEKMDLQFYDALNKPVRQEVTGKKNTPNEIVPKKETGRLVIQVPIMERVPVKTSRKAATLNKAALDKTLFKDKGSGKILAKAKNKNKDKVPLAKTQVTTETLVKKEKQVPAKVAVTSGQYTIQVAAYTSFSDAVTQMALLEKKGFASYRTLGKKQGVSWYRVRVGSFATRKAASLYAQKLKHAKIEAMIIKKE
jgi:cell division protein FtsN